jgi:hypothetical protein
MRSGEEQFLVLSSQLSVFSCQSSVGMYAGLCAKRIFEDLTSVLAQRASLDADVSS